MKSLSLVLVLAMLSIAGVNKYEFTYPWGAKLIVNTKEVPNNYVGESVYLVNYNYIPVGNEGIKGLQVYFNDKDSFEIGSVSTEIYSDDKINLNGKELPSYIETGIDSFMCPRDYHSIHDYKLYSQSQFGCESDINGNSIFLTGIEKWIPIPKNSIKVDKFSYKCIEGMAQNDKFQCVTSNEYQCPVGEITNNISGKWKCVSSLPKKDIVSDNKKGTYKDNQSENDMNDMFGKGVLIGLVGIVSAIIIVSLSK